MSKTAAVRSQARRAALTKSAGLATDYLATIPSQVATLIPGLGLPVSLANAGGAYGGTFANPSTDKNPGTDGLSLLPGVGQYRLGQRIRRVMNESDRRGARGSANVIAEQLGGMTSTLVGGGLGAAAGGGIGALAGGRDAAGVGAIVGSVAGAALPQLIGGIVAGIRRKRTLEEQAKADTTGRAVAKYLVPGLGTYDSLKRLGASTHLDAKPKKTDKKTKKAAEAYADGFRKAAEIAGVDPVALYKQAAPWATIGKMVGKGLGVARSLGGSAARLGQAAGAAAARTHSGQSVMSAGQRYIDLMRGGNVAQLKSKAQNLRSLAGRYNLDAMTAPSPELVANARGVAGRAMRQAGRAEGMLAREQRAVDLARVGTFGGLTGAGLLALRGGEQESMPVQGGVFGNQQSQELGRQLASRRSVTMSAPDMARQGWLNA